MTDKNINDGGPAFPCELPLFGAVPNKLPGMSLRDWLAGMAMQGIISNANYMLPDIKEFSIDEKVAFESYLIADAMLQERGK